MLLLSLDNAHDDDDDHMESTITCVCVCGCSLGGQKVGLFSTRTPHRPNPIGLTVVRLDGVHEYVHDYELYRIYIFECVC